MINFTLESIINTDDVKNEKIKTLHDLDKYALKVNISNEKETKYFNLAVDGSPKDILVHVLTFQSDEKFQSDFKQLLVKEFGYGIFYSPVATLSGTFEGKNYLIDYFQSSTQDFDYIKEMISQISLDANRNNLVLKSPLKMEYHQLKSKLKTQNKIIHDYLIINT